MHTLVELLLQRSRTNSQHPVVQWLPNGLTIEQTLDYAELVSQARTVAAWLQHHHRGQTPVLVCCPNGPAALAALFGCFFAGVIAIPLPATGGRRRLAQLEVVAQQTQATTVLTTAATAAALRDQLGAYPALQAAGWQAVEQLDPSLAQAWQAPTITATTTAYLQYTSGSTTVPKGVVISHAQLVSNLAQMVQRYKLSASDVGLFWLPFYHDMGLIASLLAPIYVGGQVLLMPPEVFAAQPLRWLEALSLHRATVSAAPPSAYRLCLERSSAAERQRLDLSAWRVAILGAEPIYAPTLHAFTQAFAAQGFRATALCPSYGLAEATLIVTAHHAAQPPRILTVEAHALAQGHVREVVSGGQALVSCGPPVADCTVVIVAPGSQIRLAADAVGEIWVRGPQVAPGYWQRPEAAQATFNGTLAGEPEGGFLRTGDLGFVHAGELFIVGRAKDLLIVNGENYAPEDLEQLVLEAHPQQIESVACFAVAQAEGEEIVMLMAWRRTWRDARDAAQREALSTSAQRRVTQATGLWIAAVGLIAPGQMPHTTSGKLQRFRCRERFLAAATEGLEVFTYPQPQPSARQAANASSFTLDFVAQRLHMPVTSLNRQQRLSELGLGSLDAALLRAQLAEHYGVEVPLAWLVANPTLEEFLERVGGG